MSTAAIVGLILLAILVGAIVPVLYQAAQTLKSARRQIDALGPRVDQALKELTEVTQKINRIADTVEDQTDRLKPVVDSVVGIGHSLNKVRHSVSKFSTVIGAVGPAVVAGLGAFLAHRRARSRTAAATEDESEDEFGSTNDDAHPGVAPPNTRAAVPEDHYGQ